MNVRRCICCRARPGFRDPASLQSRYGCRVFVPLATLMIFAMCLITYSIFQIYGIFHAKASINNLPILQNDDLYELSIKSTIQKNWKKVNDDGTPKEDEVVLWGRILVNIYNCDSIILLHSNETYGQKSEKCQNFKKNFFRQFTRYDDMSKFG